jgi:hypothetical protein
LLTLAFDLARDLRRLILLSLEGFLEQQHLQLGPFRFSRGDRLWRSWLNVHPSIDIGVIE